jgi:hypothetical protein
MLFFNRLILANFPFISKTLSWAHLGMESVISFNSGRFGWKRAMCVLNLVLAGRFEVGLDGAKARTEPVSQTQAGQRQAR